MELIKPKIGEIQALLNFEGFRSYQFGSNKGLGKVGIGGFLLGVFFGISSTSLVFCTLLVNILDRPWSILYTLVRMILYYIVLVAHKVGH